MGKLLLGIATLLALGAACVTTRASLEAELSAAPTAEAKGRILYDPHSYKAVGQIAGSSAPRD